MKIKIMIVDFEIAPRVKRWAIRIGIPIAVVTGGGALAFASLPQFKDGDTLTAKSLNDEFLAVSKGQDAMDARVAALEGQHLVYGVLDASCKFASQSGGISTVNNGPGDCTVVFAASTFSSPPTCVATSQGQNGTFPRYAYVVKAIADGTATSARFKHMSVDTLYGPPNGATAAENFAVICVGK
jgi:hypothetical protein